MAIGRPKAYTPAGALFTKVLESHAGQDRNPILGLLTSIRDTHGSVLKSSEGGWWPHWKRSQPPSSVWFLVLMGLPQAGEGADDEADSGGVASDLVEGEGAL